MNTQVLVFVFVMFFVAFCKASQGVWQSNLIYDVVVWHGYRLSDLQLRVADKIVLPIANNGNYCVVAKGWTCDVKMNSFGVVNSKRFTPKDLNLKEYCGNKKSGGYGDLNAWLDLLFYTNEKHKALLLGALPLNLYPSILLSVLDAWQLNLLKGGRINDIQGLLPWQRLGWMDSPKMELDLYDVLLPSLMNKLSEVTWIDNVYSVNDKKFEDGGSEKYPGKITLLHPRKGLSKYEIDGVRVWDTEIKKEIGSVTFMRGGRKLECQISLNECRIAVCDKHKELRRLYFEFELISPDLFTVAEPNLKVERCDGTRPNSLIFFVGIQVQPRNASEICIDDYDEDDELLEDEDEEL